MMKTSLVKQTELYASHYTHLSLRKNKESRWVKGKVTRYEPVARSSDDWLSDVTSKFLTVFKYALS